MSDPVHFAVTDAGVHVTQGGVTITIPPRLFWALFLDLVPKLPR